MRTKKKMNWPCSVNNDTSFHSEVPAMFPAGLASLYSACWRNKIVGVASWQSMTHGISEDQVNTYWPLPTIIVSLKGYCFLNLQDLRFNGVYPFQNLWIAHKADKPINRKKHWTNWYPINTGLICFYTIITLVFSFLIFLSICRTCQNSLI